MISKEKVLKSIEVLPLQKAVNVCWVNQIIEDGNLLSEVPHRCVYDQEQKEQFLLDVEGAENYLAALGW